jgi:DNA-binding MarR family transcriptional regulator
LTKKCLSGILGEMSPKLAIAVQRFYPQIYGACHVDHVRARSTVHRVSAQDSTLLAHLDEDEPLRTGRLARHLGISASTLSAAIKRLAELGYLSRTASPRDRRQVELRLTAQGAEAMASTSVLDRDRVAAVLALLAPAEQARAVAGLGLLAGAATRLQLTQPRRRKLP